MSDDVAWYNGKTVGTIKKRICDALLQMASWIAYLLAALISLTAGKIQDILKPKLIEYKFPEYVYSSFTLYATIFVILGYFNTKVIKKIIALEDVKKNDDFTEADKEEIKKMRQMRIDHKAELARLNALLSTKDKIIVAMHEEKGVQAKVDYYNSVESVESRGRPAAHANSDYDVRKNNEN